MMMSLPAAFEQWNMSAVHVVFATDAKEQLQKPANLAIRIAD